MLDTAGRGFDHPDVFVGVEGLGRMLVELSVVEQRYHLNHEIMPCTALAGVRPSTQSLHERSTEGVTIASPVIYQEEKVRYRGEPTTPQRREGRGTRLH